MDTTHVLLLLFLTTTSTLLVYSAKDHGCQRRVCYFNNKAQYRNTSQTRFMPANIDLTLCTHIIYYSARLRKHSIEASDERDLSTDSSVGNYEKVIKLKQKGSKLKVLLTLDAWRCDREPFFSMSRSKKSRFKFIVRIINYLRKHKFDGLDFRCVYIRNDTIPPEVKNSLSDLVQELRQAIDQEATGSDRLLLTLIVYGERAIDESGYDVTLLSHNVDWINLWAVDLHGDWYPTTGHPSPLFAGNEGIAKYFSVDTAVKYWLRNGAPRGKIVLALPSFGRSYTLTKTHTGDGAPAKEGGSGPNSGISGGIAYYEVCNFIQATGTVIRFLRSQMVPYLVFGEKWVGYDDVTSIARKILFLKKRRLGGFALVWVDTDDFKGRFCKQGPYPLLKAAVAACDKPL